MTAPHISEPDDAPRASLWAWILGGLAFLAVWWFVLATAR